MLQLILSVLLSPLSPQPGQDSTPPSLRVRIERDNLVVRESCTLVAPASALVDADGNGVVQIVGDDIHVHFASPEPGARGLHGAPEGQAPEDYTGIGIRISGQNVKLTGARVSGYRVGIQAESANRLELLECDVSDNRRDRLRSGAQAEALEDWLWPHHNDEGEWAARYGAGIYLQGGEYITVSRCRAREVQNGLILERTRAALVSDNDFSFLSGWGIALWRANQNFITRNAVDFCIRGYSHGVYNRGQDSAGILLFEQCSQNVIAENSATHGGDGFFAFAGKEALGESGPPDLDRLRRGNNDNIIARNDFSYAAAHGLELTFSFGNRIFSNRMVENGICGIWAGYSRETVISENLFVRNGQAGSRGEGGGINIEHGQRNYVLNNEFLENSVGVRLWWDEDPALEALPWTQANGYGSGDNLLVSNRFSAGPLGIELLLAGPTTLAGNEFSELETEIQADEASQPNLLKSIGLSWEKPEFPIFGKTKPVGARSQWNGRQHILMGPYGPCDLSKPQLWQLPSPSAQHTYRLVGAGSFEEPEVSSGVKLVRDGDSLILRGKRPGVQPYELSIQHRASREAEPRTMRASGVLVQASWDVRFFAWEEDPREDPEGWRRAAEAAEGLPLAELNLAFQGGAPAELRSVNLGNHRDALAALPGDRFGTLAQTELSFPAGRWRLRCVADDGVRVWVDDELLIDAWKWQPATAYHTDLELEEPATLRLRVEHFELDGAAQLSLDIQRAPAAD